MTLPSPPENWDIDRLNTERAEAVAAFGLTERQARFLVEVMIHSGAFVERQYCNFAGIAHGQKTHDFLQKLVERGYARPIQGWAAPSRPALPRGLQAALRGDWPRGQPAPEADVHGPAGGPRHGPGCGARGPDTDIRSV